VDASGNATPNYGRETAPEGVTLTAALVQPAGGNAPALTNPSAFGNFSSGAATGTTFAWPEVGIVTLTPAVADANYLGAGNVTGTTSGNVGRFVPASFALTGAATVTHRSGAACSPASTFTYLGENFSLGFTLAARDAAGATTQNYTGGFAKLGPTVAADWKLAGISGTTTFSTAGGRLTLGSASGAWSNGIAAVTLNASALPAATPDGPFNAAFGIAPVDSDGVGMATLNLDTDAVANGADRALLGQVLLRHGRLRLQNAMSAASRVLRLPLTAQYWDSATASFKTNDLDSCTRITAANLSFGNFRKALTAADAVMSPSTVTVDPTKPVFITLAAPSGGRTGSLDVAIALGANTTDASCLSWTPSVAATAGANLNAMRGAWCGSASALRDPSARATWGLYRGADGVIYQRENY
jgi:MSHA biogenesis protein MshQ